MQDFNEKETDELIVRRALSAATPGSPGLTFGELSGPTAAVTGAGLFVFGGTTAVAARPVPTWTGCSGTGVSGTAVLHRVSATHEAHLHSERPNNLPRVEPDEALADAREALAATSAVAEGVSAALLDVAPAVRA